MVAKITVPKSIIRALNYNEQKIKERRAECIYANGFLTGLHQLNFHDKLHRFENLIALNKRATTNTIHISLNFSPGEKLDTEKLCEIGAVYMNKIGFGEQPFLIYQHHDAGHPHIHIVSTNIQANGKRISLHNLGKIQSENARKEIELIYHLIKAEKQTKYLSEQIHAVRKINYGKSETKRGITNVLDAVLPVYKYSSLAELNAVLKLYNVIADRGREDGIIFKKQGLVYRVLDELGNKIGVPIKASSLYNRPTLAFLQKRFSENEILKRECKKNLKTSIDWIMVKPPKNLEAFKDAMQKEKISLVIRQNDAGIIYGLTYIDHRTQSVFNGSDIGKEYSAKAILEKCIKAQTFNIKKTKQEIKLHSKEIIADDKLKSKEQQQGLSRLVDELIKPAQLHNYLPFQLRKKKRKRKQ
ncbi:MAG TPA: relaxase/mobilization nuclease domain-containing protein [Hanamia sp.]|nr:relaxase/mobilization nuclease domain-containing protein [Hanamia sp.]